MNTLLVLAIIFMTLALTFYSIGVFGEKIQGTLKVWHTVVFWFGFVCDTTGTTIMSRLSGQGFSMNLHSVTGLIALLLMLFHALWATWILWKQQEQAKQTFHKFSITVWAIWLIPYVLGMIIGMRG